MMSSREYKKAVGRNNAFEGNLQKNLDDIEGQRNRFIRSQREKKMKFIHKVSSLPKLRLPLRNATEENIAKSPAALSRHLSLDDSTLSELHEKRLAAEKRFSIPCLTTSFTVTQDSSALKKLGSGRETNNNGTVSLESHAILTKSPQTRRILLDRQLSLPESLNTAVESGHSLSDGMTGGHNVPRISEVGVRRNLMVSVQFVSLGTQLPHSPLLQRKQRSMSLDPTDLGQQQQSVSLPGSPCFRRRRAQTWNPENQQWKEMRAELGRLRSLGINSEETSIAGQKRIESSFGQLNLVESIQGQKDVSGAELCMSQPGRSEDAAVNALKNGICKPSGKELAKKDAIYIDKVKKALDKNSTYDIELKKSLSCLQKERRSFINTLSKEKLDFVKRKCKLPSIRLVQSGRERENAQTKIAEFCCDVWSKDTLKRRADSPVSESRCSSSASSKDMNSFPREKSVLFESGSTIKRNGSLDQPRIAWLSKDAENKGSATDRTNSPSLEYPPPRSSPSPHSLYFRSLEQTDLERCRSLPGSPCGRRRANTLDTPRNLSHAKSFDNLKRPVERSQSTPLRDPRPRAESTPPDFEEANNSFMSPRAPLSPRIRRLRLASFHGTGAGQSEGPQDDPLELRLPRLQHSRGSLPGTSREGQERQKRRFHGMASEKLAIELSPRQEALSHPNISPKLVEKQHHPAGVVGNEYFNGRSTKTDFAMEGAEFGETPVVQGDGQFGWYTNDDDQEASGSDEGENEENPFTFQVNEKKIHSMEEIQYTRYLRMKSPNHWLPKMGKVPLNLLSSSIIVGHTRLPYETVSSNQDEEEDEGEDEQNSVEEKDSSKTGDDVKESQKVKTENEEFEDKEIDLDYSQN